MVNRLRLNEKSVREAKPETGRDYQIFGDRPSDDGHDLPDYLREAAAICPAAPAW